MISRVASRPNQRGITLVELLIASLVGLLVIGTIGSVFIQNYKLTNERSKQLLLEQSLSSVMMQVKEDIQRAGFNADSARASVLSGATATIHVDEEKELVGYTYRLDSEGSASFRNVVFKRQESSHPSEGHALKICEKLSVQPLSIEATALSGGGGFCFNLFNPNQISISNFSVVSEIVASDKRHSRLVTLSISGHLIARAENEYHVQSSVLQRNH